ncbi:SDR family oxidoreductase [Micromonospora sp. NPDC050200]|uniref:SDR family NAD(P)-dependent oxidoreductase n=1 Tax=Micromonospora sp. NPDC050200 TaxID=3155664 RepID=UPI0033C14349
MSEAGCFQDRVALVLGVGRPPGIGRATALRLAARGAHVICVDDLADEHGPRDTAQVPPALFDEIVAEVDAAGPGRAFGVAYPHRRDWPDLVHEVVTEFGRLDICCTLNGATGAQAGDGPLLELASESFERCFAVNVTWSLRLLSAAARAMIQLGRPGALVALSSHAARRPTPGIGALGAARAAVEHLVAVLAKEVAPYGIRCNAVSPLAVGPSRLFPNPGLVTLAEREAGSLDRWLSRDVPLGRSQGADETAAVIEFLCSDQASYLTGVTVPVHGGAS